MFKRLKNFHKMLYHNMFYYMYEESIEKNIAEANKKLYKKNAFLKEYSNSTYVYTGKKYLEEFNHLIYQQVYILSEKK